MEAERDFTNVEDESVAQPEAGFSLNWQMVDGYNATVQVTMRTAHVGDWPDVMKRRAEFMERATKNGWNVPGRLPSAAAPAAVSGPAPVGKLDLSQPGGHMAKPTAPAASNGAGEVLTLVATKMEVTPKPDGKVELKFFEAGHKYPDLYVTRSVDEMVKLLAPNGQWTAEEHLSKAATFEPVAITVRYTLSAKLNSKGNPYKDLVNIS